MRWESSLACGRSSISTCWSTWQTETISLSSTCLKFCHWPGFSLFSIWAFRWRLRHGWIRWCGLASACSASTMAPVACGWTVQTSFTSSGTNILPSGNWVWSSAQMAQRTRWHSWQKSSSCSKRLTWSSVSLGREVSWNRMQRIQPGYFWKPCLQPHPGQPQSWRSWPSVMLIWSGRPCGSILGKHASNLLRKPALKLSMVQEEESQSTLWTWATRMMMTTVMTMAVIMMMTSEKLCIFSL